MTEFRTERDSLGTVAVPRDRYWGAETQRSLEQFPIGEERLPRVFLRAYGLLKREAARVNAALGLLPEPQAGLIARAADEVCEGALDAHFPLVVWQTGSGTQTHMNVNEVIANRANELAGAPLGSKRPVDPHDHVNLGQSSNDTFPTAMHVASVLALTESLLPALDGLLATLDGKAAAFAGVLKVGRTHLQDALPLSLGQEIGGWAAQLRLARSALDASLPRLHELAIGGSAVGTGFLAHAEFGPRVARALAQSTGHPFVCAENHFAALAGHEAMLALSSGLQALAVALTKVANDVRWLASGPRCGLGELAIPENEPGSSIMPGKVNPTQAEALLMVCLRVMGHHVSLAFAASQGNFELNCYKPLIAHDALRSIALLSDAVASFDLRCARGIEPRRELLANAVSRSLMLVTALVPHIGHDAAARIARKAHVEGLSLREAALALGLVDAASFDDWVRPERMLGPGSS